MQTEVIEAGSPHAIDRALRVLREGGLVAFPTDTVYGVAAMAFDEAAVQSIYAAKGRSEEKAIPVLLGDPGELDRVATALPERARRLTQRFWPGPLTLVVFKHRSLPRAVSAGDTVGVRVPDHPVALALLKAAGPLAVTSANRSGNPSPCTAGDVLDQLRGRIALIVDGGKTPGGISSTVLDCTKLGVAILREGPITMQQIRAALAQS